VPLSAYLHPVAGFTHPCRKDTEVRRELTQKHPGRGPGRRARS